MFKSRPGSALILVLLMTLAVAGLAVAAIFLSSSAGLLSRFYDRERDYRLAAESALEIARSRLLHDSTFAVPDTGVMQIAAGQQIQMADGSIIPRVRVNVYAAATGDTTGQTTPHVTLIAAAYDNAGTRHLRRMDLRRESFSRYTLLANQFPNGESHGPGFVPGRVHTNDTWRSSSGDVVYADTVTASGSVQGSGSTAYQQGNRTGVPPIWYPRDSTFARLDSLAAEANLAFTPLTGAGVGTRVEFVAFDANGDGVVSADEGFVKVFDLAGVIGVDTNRLRGSPEKIEPSFWIISSAARYAWYDPIVQHQCGAFYRYGRGSHAPRWHFFPISAHRLGYVRNALTSSPANNRYPHVSNAAMDIMDDYSYLAVNYILSQPTARCFPAGSPYLMPSERFVNSSGAVTGGSGDTRPFGTVPPPGGWPASASYGYGGSDTTFTPRSRTCHPSAFNNGVCSGVQDLGSWRTFAGSAPAGVPGSVRQGSELQYLWPISPPYNTESRGVVSARSGPLYVSGETRGNVTLRVAGRATLVDHLVHHPSAAVPNPANECTDNVGILAMGDVLVVEGLTSRVRRIGETSLLLAGINMTSHLGAARRFQIDASLMSLTGTVGAENPGVSMGDGGSQIRCPEGSPVSNNSNGGCLVHTGGASMNRYSQLYNGSNTGFRYHGAVDRCQLTAARPPFFPLTNRYAFVRSIQLEPTRGNTPEKIRALLMSLKGRSLD